MENCKYAIGMQKIIEGAIKNGKKEFVIYPFGCRGKLAKEILNIQFGIKEKMILDNYVEVKDLQIVKMVDVNMDELQGYTILLCSDNEAVYCEIRQQLYRCVPKEQVIDMFPIAAKFDSIDKEYYRPILFKEPRLAMLESLSREIYRNNVQGAVAEAGVYKGEFAKYINLMFPNKKLYLFDTFKGFDQRDISYDVEKRYIAGTAKTIWKDTTIEYVLSNMIYPKNCIVKKGYFPQSGKNLDEKFCFVSIDMDLYKPIYEGLKFFYAKLVSGGYLYIHDGRNAAYPGAKEAVVEFCSANNIGYVILPDDAGTVVITK